MVSSLGQVFLAITQPYTGNRDGRPLRDTTGIIRRRLADPACPRDFPIVVDLDEQGITDYLILPLPFSDRARYGVSFATKAAGGFTNQQLNRLAQLTPTLASVVEILSVRRIAQNLMTTYLGRETGQRVLDGMIQRGSTESINAAIWYSDLRGFTYLTDRLPSNVLISLLNDHFERIVGPIEANGGEVLKFMGDALLQSFRSMRWVAKRKRQLPPSMPSTAHWSRRPIVTLSAARMASRK